MKMFTRKNKPNYVSSTILTERIGKLEAEQKDIAARLEAAESAMVKDAGNDAAYSTASDEATKLRAELAGKESVLVKMQSALKESLETEQTEFCNTLENEREHVLQRQAEALDEVAYKRSEEQERHDKVTREIDAIEKTAKEMHLEIEHKIELAAKGVREAACVEAAALRTRKRKLMASIPPGMQSAYNIAKSKLSNVESQFAMDPSFGAPTANDKPHYEQLARERIKEARAEVDRIGAEWLPIHDELAGINGRISELTNVG